MLYFNYNIDELWEHFRDYYKSKCEEPVRDKLGNITMPGFRLNQNSNY